MSLEQNQQWAWPGHLDAVAIYMLLRRLPAGIMRLEELFNADMELNKARLPQVTGWFSFDDVFDIAKKLSYLHLSIPASGMDTVGEILVQRNYRATLFIERMPQELKKFVDTLRYTNVLEAIAQATFEDES